MGGPETSVSVIERCYCGGGGGGGDREPRKACREHTLTPAVACIMAASIRVHQ